MVLDAQAQTAPLMGKVKPEIRLSLNPSISLKCATAMEQGSAGEIALHSVWPVSPPPVVRDSTAANELVLSVV